MNLDRAVSTMTAALFGLSLGMLAGRFATVRTDRLTVEAQALQLARDREETCSMARWLVKQHEVVQHVWPESPKPVAVVQACDQSRPVVAWRLLK